MLYVQLQHHERHTWAFEVLQALEILSVAAFCEPVIHNRSQCFVARVKIHIQVNNS